MADEFKIDIPKIDVDAILKDVKTNAANAINTNNNYINYLNETVNNPNTVSRIQHDAKNAAENNLEADTGNGEADTGNGEADMITSTSSPNSSRNYDDSFASKESERTYDNYKNTLKKYRDEAGIKIADKVANRQATMMANNALRKEERSVYGAMQNSGLTRAAALGTAQTSGIHNYGTNFANAYDKSYNTELQRQQNEISNALALEQEARARRQETWNRNFGLASFITGMIFSDEKTKNILDKWGFK